MLFGTDNTAWQDMTADVPISLMTAYRYYFQPADGIPARWPSLPAGVTGIVSLKPNHTNLFAGTLTDAWHAFCATAPEGSLVTFDHECNRTEDAATVQQLHTWLRDNAPANVRPGAIYSGYKPQHGQDLTPFIVPGLSWYTTDAYNVDSPAQTPRDVIGPSYDAIRAVVGASVDVGITETNSLFDVAGWLTSAFNWAVSKDAFCFLPFFNSPPSDPNPYLYSSDYAPELVAIATTAAETSNMPSFQCDVVTATTDNSGYLTHAFAQPITKALVSVNEPQAGQSTGIVGASVTVTDATHVQVRCWQADNGVVKTLQNTQVTVTLMGIA